MQIRDFFESRRCGIPGFFKFSFWRSKRDARHFYYFDEPSPAFYSANRSLTPSCVFFLWRVVSRLRIIGWFEALDYWSRSQVGPNSFDVKGLYKVSGFYGQCGVRTKRWRITYRLDLIADLSGSQKFFHFQDALGVLWSFWKFNSVKTVGRYCEAFGSLLSFQSLALSSRILKVIMFWDFLRILCGNSRFFNLVESGNRFYLY